MRELQNVIERAVWFADGDTIHVEHLAESLRATAESVLPPRERRTQVADELYTALVSAGYSFWNHISPLFLFPFARHPAARHARAGAPRPDDNARELRALLRLFGMPPGDYKRFLNCLAVHGCRADFREFRNGLNDGPRRPRLVLPPLDPKPPAPVESSGNTPVGR